MARHRSIRDAGEVTPIRRLAEYDALDKVLVSRLLAHGERLDGPHFIDAALSYYLGGADVDLPDDEIVFAMGWAMFTLPSLADKHTTIAASYLDYAPARLTEPLRRRLSAHCAAYYSVWRVESVELRQGVTVRDLLTQQSRTVIDPRFADAAAPGDVLLARVVDDAIASFGGMHPAMLNDDYADVVVSAIKRRFRRRIKPIEAARVREFGKQIGLLRVWQSVLQLIEGLGAEETVDDVAGEFVPGGVAMHGMPQLSNTDGEPMVMTTDDFALLTSPKSVLPLLATIEGAQPPNKEGGEMAVVITRPGGSGPRGMSMGTVIGRIGVSKGQLTIDTNSERRANELRAHVSRVLGDQIRFRERKQTTAAEFMAEMHRLGVNPPPMPAHLEPSEDEQAFAREFMSWHMLEKWPHEKVPALGGRTPMQAAKTAEGRALLVPLLEDFALRDAARPPEERVDMDALRRVLGLPVSRTEQ